jgi:23S rRNA (uracil1939-C5)-methyltransferase
MQRSHRTKLNTEQPTVFSFAIESVDGLGQGVDKSADKITFISKTLPQETGTAKIIKQKKGVRFAQLQTLDKHADNRITPSCPHFNECPGCAYLHTDYSSELSYKKAALQRLMQRFDAPAIEVLAAPERLHYRNRVQLHYRDDVFGMLDGDNDQLLPIPLCQLAAPELQASIDQLYQQKVWRSQKQSSGHCEVALIEGEVKVFWNKPYAYGGFSQVNSAMNDVLCEQVLTHVLNAKPNAILDLFSGNGNLSNGIIARSAITRQMVDVAENPHPDFVQLDLFAPKALPTFLTAVKQTQFDTLLIDPPRKGFVELASWVAALKPKQLIYVSCNAATMARDLAQIQQPFTIETVQLLDMFPSTKHFETLAVIAF